MTKEKILSILESAKDKNGAIPMSLVRKAFEKLPSAQPETHEERTETHACDCIDQIDRESTIEPDTDTISRQAAIDAILAVTGNSSVRELYEHVQEHGLSDMWSGGVNAAIDIIIAVPSAQPDQGKYEYHYDHTDCIWYRPEARNRCPVTCAQYRDGWNDAMNYIFRDGKGYRPYIRGKQYEE